MSTLMARALSDGEFNQSLRSHSPIQAAKFSWADSAKRALGALEEVHARKIHSGRRSWATVLADREDDYRTLIDAVASVSFMPVGPAEEDLVAAADAITRNQANLEKATRFGELPDSISWRVEGPFDSSYSLALLNKETALALDALGHHVMLHSTEGPGDFPPNPKFLLRNPRLAEMHARAATVPPEQADVSSRILYPPRVTDMCSRINLLHHYAWEESGFPLEWIGHFNAHLQGMTCLSRHVEKIMIDNGVAVPLSVSGCGVDHWERIDPDEGYRIEAKSFRFLHVSSCFPRKGADVLLRAYGRSFTSADDVTLVIKTFANPHNQVRKWLEDARSNRPDYPDVVIIEDDLTDAQLKALHEQCNVLVAPSRAEGYGLPIAEAMLSGLGVITTGWGGQLDFCSEETAWMLDYSFAPAVSHFDLFNSVWAEPDQEHLSALLREVHVLPPSQLRERSRVGRERLLERSTWQHVAGRLVESARRFAVLDEPVDFKIGWVSSWNTKCGIATYSGHLLNAMPATDLKLFASRTSVQTGEDDSRVVRCWDSGDNDDLEELAAAIDASGVSTVVLQFQYGFFNFDGLARLLRRQRQSGRSVVLMMHATIDAPETPHKKLRDLGPALAGCERLFVHGPGDLNRLKALGLIENVALFPHGVIDVPIVERSRPDGRFMVCSYGFFLPHKGLLQLIQAMAELVASGRDVHLKMVNAEYPAPESRAMIEQARTAIKELGLESRVTLITDFLQDHESLSELDEADVIVFPYQSTGESSSAAVRYGLATGRSVAVTPLPIFDDVRRAVTVLPGRNPREIAEGIISIMEGASPPTEASRWREDHKYTKLAQRLKSILVQLEGRRRGK